MKRQYTVGPVICLLAALLLGGCAAVPSDLDSGRGASGDWLLSAQPEYVAQWPENDFTACIPEPENGSVGYVCDYSDSGRYEVVLKNISQSESETYVSQLLDLEYVEVLSESNDISAGIMLQDEEVVLSIAYSDGSMNILITMGSAVN